MHFRIVPKRLQGFNDRSKDEAELRLKLEDMLEALKEASREISKPITIVLDGLDYFDYIKRKQRKDFLKVLKCIRLTLWKCLVTSRVGRSFFSNACDSSTHPSIKEEDVAADVRTSVDNFPQIQRCS